MTSDVPIEVQGLVKTFGTTRALDGLDLRPYAHAPALPGGEVAWSTQATLVVLAAALTTAGFTSLRRRDLG